MEKKYVKQKLYDLIQSDNCTAIKIYYCSHKEHIDDITNKNELFVASCYVGNIDVMKFIWDIFKDKLNQKIIPHIAFRWLCYNNKLDACKWLWNIVDGGLINIIKNEKYINDLFYWTIKHLHIDMAYWLYSVAGDNIHIQTNNHYIFNYVCQMNCIDLAILCCKICDKYRIKITNNTIEWNVIKLKDAIKLNTKIKQIDDTDKCCICLDYNDQLYKICKCNFLFCHACLMILNEDICICCKKYLNYDAIIQYKNIN